MKLKEITFQLENCDWITIDGKYVCGFVVDDIHQWIGRIACNSIMKMDIVDTFAIEIHKDANVEYYEFEQEQIPSFKTKKFDRLTAFRDITHIQFTLTDDTYEPIEDKYEFTLHWVGDRDETNEAQKSLISKCGNLYIVVADGKEISDFFDMEEINDEEAMDLKFNMCDVGDKYSDPKRYEREEDSEEE